MAAQALEVGPSQSPEKFRWNFPGDCELAWTTYADELNRTCVLKFKETDTKIESQQSSLYSEKTFGDTIGNKRTRKLIRLDGLSTFARPIISADKYYRALTLIGHISPRIDAYTNAHEQPLITNNATNAHHL